MKNAVHFPAQLRFLASESKVSVSFHEFCIQPKFIVGA